MDEKKLNLSKPRTPTMADSDTDGPWMLLGKLAPPQQRVISARRAALLDRLDASSEAALSVVVSPPGFGKTTLLTQWWRELRSRETAAVCWLTLDEVDAEPTRFLAGLILAIARSGIDVGALEIAASQQAVDANVRAVLAGLIAAIRRRAMPVVVILDDYHRARSGGVDSIIETLIENAHPLLRLVVSSRVRPTFHVSALSVRGLVTLIDASDLSMSRNEAYEIIGPNVSDEDLSLVYTRTEGWAVALQLARLWIDRGQRRPGSLKEFSGRTTEMTEYLAEQIVQDLPTELREFLLETSILERFDANLADAVRGRNDSAALLEGLSHLDALLVRLDGPHDTFRYHAIFADFLVQRLHRGPPGRVATQHRRAAQWLANAGDLVEAVKHAIKAGDLPLAVQLVQEGGGWELVLWRGVGYVRTLLNVFSDMTIRSDPTLQITQAYLHLKLGQYASAQELLSIAAAGLESATPRTRRDYLIISATGRAYMDDVAALDGRSTYEQEVESLDVADHLGRGALLGSVATTALANAKLDTAERASRTAIQQMREAGSIIGTNYFFLHFGQSQIHAAKLREAEALYREALAMAEENFGADSALKAISNTYLAECLYLRDDLPTARQLIAESLETIEATDGWLDVYATAYDIAIRLAHSTENLDATLRMISRSAETAKSRGLRRLHALSAAWRVEQLVLAGHLRDAKREASAARLSDYAEVRGAPDYHWRVRLASTFALGRLALASGASAQALNLLDQTAADFSAGGLHLAAHRLNALAALTLMQRGGADDEAVERLESLIRLIVEEGAWRVVLEEGLGLESILHLAQRRNREMVLSSAQRDVTTQLLVKLQGRRPPEVQGLSSRELAVLRELCNGRSNKLIGQLLDLSENTVKFHLKNIFKKLEVDSRAAAIACAMQRGLAEPTHPPRH